MQTPTGYSYLASHYPDLARRLLPTLDDLPRVSSTPPETTTVEALDAGLDLILRNLRKELEDAGLTRIEALGERFNPELHQALMTAETPDASSLAPLAIESPCSARTMPRWS